jgi:hypothetical protein
MSGALLLMAVGSSPPGVVTLSGETVSGGAVTHGVQVNSDGTVDKEIDGVFSQIDSGTDWIIPNASANALFEVRATLNSGSLSTSAGTDIWLSLDEDRYWNTTVTANITLEIRYQGVVLTSGVYVL